MSTGNPILDNAVAGVAVEVAKGLYRTTPAQKLIKRVFGRDATASRAAESNTLEFLSRLSLRVEKLEGDSANDSSAVNKIREALSDPDVAYSFREAILSGARTSSKQRHELLARAVAERLNAEPHSAKAVASNQAIEVIKHLTSDQLDVLGLLALVHAVRPRHLIPPDVDVDEALDWSEEGRRRADEQALAYAQWFREQRALYTLPLPTSDALFAHLVATGCILYERQVLRHLGRTLQPDRSEEAEGRNTPFFVALSFSLGEAEYDFIDDRTRFSHLWERDLQHALPTPTGLMIGIHVHGVKSGHDFSQEWEWASRSVPRNPVVDTAVWDGDRISRHFLDRLDEEINDRAERNVAPWHALRRR